MDRSVLDVIENRCSLRQFDTRAIEPEVEEAILEAAMRSPTATNRMLYSILTIRDQKTKDILAETCNHQGFISKAPLILVFLADQQKLYDFYEYSKVPEMCEEKGMRYMVPAEHHFLLGAHDAINAAENAVIAAESLGVGSCYIGHIVSWYEKHRDLFELPPLTFPVTMLVLGYPKPGAVRKKSPRFDKKYVVFEEKYKRLRPEEIEDMYRRMPYTENNRYGAKNSGQLYYMNRYHNDAPYRESVRSVKAALKNWTG